MVYRSYVSGDVLGQQDECSANSSTYCINYGATIALTNLHVRKNKPDNEEFLHNSKNYANIMMKDLQLVGTISMDKMTAGQITGHSKLNGYKSDDNTHK